MQIYKIFIIDGKHYVTIDEDVVVGDNAIVSVGDQFPTLVKCQNDEQISLFQKPKTSLTKRHKVIKENGTFTIPDDIIDYAKNKDGATIIKIVDGIVSLIDDSI